MVYASVPAYLDPPNWNQQQLQHQQHQQHHHQQQQQQHQGHQAGGSGGGANGGGDVHQQLLPPVPSRPEGGSMAGTVRAGSMADRARVAKVPQPEPALKCPRCESTNTKFCYFNNYSLSQPRHFCKTCRRYWTRGGALRNVPVGGGCRRNKRSKSSSSKSSASNSQAGTSTAGATSGGGGAIGFHMTPPPQLPFVASLHPLSDYATTNTGLNYGGIQSMDSVDYQVGSSSGSLGLEQWRFQQLQQFPFFAGLEQQAQAPSSLGLLYEEVGVDGAATFTGQGHGKATAAGLISQLASVKMEENQHGLNLSRQYLGIPGNDQFWNNGGGGSGAGAGSGGAGTVAGWTDLSGFNSSSTGNLL